MNQNETELSLLFMNAAQILPEKTREYLIGFAEGVAAMAKQTEEEKSA